MQCHRSPFIPACISLTLASAHCPRVSQPFERRKASRLEFSSSPCIVATSHNNAKPPMTTADANATTLKVTSATRPSFKSSLSHHCRCWSTTSFVRFLCISLSLSLHLPSPCLSVSLPLVFAPFVALSLFLLFSASIPVSVISRFQRPIALSRRTASSTASEARSSE